MNTSAALWFRMSPEERLDLLTGMAQHTPDLKTKACESQSFEKLSRAGYRELPNELQSRLALSISGGRFSVPEYARSMKVFASLK